MIFILLKKSICAFKKENLKLSLKSHQIGSFLVERVQTLVSCRKYLQFLFLLVFCWHFRIIRLINAETPRLGEKKIGIHCGIFLQSHNTCICDYSSVANLLVVHSVASNAWYASWHLSILSVSINLQVRQENRVKNQGSPLGSSFPLVLTSELLTVLKIMEGFLWTF